MGVYGGQTATELDSQANMAVAGANVLIISKSGLVATVTPFLVDLPPMDDVEIGDVAMAYDNPRKGVSFLLVNCISIAASIGGMWMGNYGGQTETEMDSHANMAVAGANVLIIPKSGLVATVTPFLADLPPMDDVEIGDVAMWRWRMMIPGRVSLVFL